MKFAATLICSAVLAFVGVYALAALEHGVNKLSAMAGEYLLVALIASFAMVAVVGAISMVKELFKKN